MAGFSYLPILLLTFAAYPAAGDGIVLANGLPNPSFQDLHAWYRPEFGINGTDALPPEGTILSSWSDSSDGGRNLSRVSTVASQRPVLKQSSGNGMPAVEFDGNDYIWASSNAAEFGILSQSRTIFTVTRVDVADGGYIFDSSSLSGRNALLSGEIANPAVWTLFTGSTPTIIGGDVAPSYLTMVTCTLNPASQNIHINGLLQSTGASALSSLNGFILGSRYNLSNMLSGGICEILVYNSELEKSQRVAIETYLRGKYELEDPPEPPTTHVVFDAGVDQYPNIRIPSILSLLDGTLLAFAEGRQGGDHAQNDIILKRSVNGGETWGALQVIDDQGGVSLNDPLPVEVRTGPHSGRVYLLYMAFPEGCHTSCVRSGYGPMSSRNWMTHSEDSGKTWTTPIDVTEIVRSKESNYAGSPGVGIQLRHGPNAGRLVLPLREGPIGNMRIYMLYSDDGGDTWHRGELIDNGTGGGSGDETSIVELDDGSLLLNARAHNGAPTFRKTSRSFDGGMSWTPLINDEELITPHCMSSIVLLNDSSDGFSTSRLLYAGPWSTNSRTNGSVLISTDGGKSWPQRTTVVPGSFAYSQLVVIDPCWKAGLLYEGENYDKIIFMPLTLEFLTQGEESNTEEKPCNDEACPADLNNDGQVNGADVGLLLSQWNGTGAGDLDESGSVDGGDMGLLLAGWGSCRG